MRKTLRTEINSPQRAPKISNKNSAKFQEVPKVTDVVLLYVTIPDKKIADQISLTLLKEGLAACTNTVGGMESRYHWQGQIKTSQEVVVIVKTLRKLFDRCRTRIESLHPYEGPCILELPVSNGNFEYLNWLRGSVG